MKDPAKALARKAAAAAAAWAVSLVVLVEAASLPGNLADSTSRLCLENSVAALLPLRVDKRWVSVL
jgi:hypothetical protein